MDWHLQIIGRKMLFFTRAKVFIYRIYTHKPTHTQTETLSRDPDSADFTISRSKPIYMSCNHDSNVTLHDFHSISSVVWHFTVRFRSMY